MKFDEGCLYKTEPNLVKMLIRENEASAKDYKRKRTKVKQAEVEELLAEFGQYTLEGIIVHVLSKVFFVGRGSDESLVRLPALVERLEESVRMEAFLLKCRRSNKKISEGRKEFLEKYPCEEGKKGSLYDAYPFGIGIALLEFMEERGLISLTTNFKESVRVRNKANFYLPKSLYVLNNFDLSLLPMKLNLPMICLPVLWNCSKNTSAPITFSDLTGGYLNALTGEIYDRYSLMSSKNPKLY